MTQHPTSQQRRFSPTAHSSQSATRAKSHPVQAPAAFRLSHVFT